MEYNYPFKDFSQNVFLWDDHMCPIVIDGIISYEDICDRLEWFMIRKADDESVDVLKKILECGGDIYDEDIKKGDVYKLSCHGWYNYSAEFRKIKDNLEILHGRDIHYGV